MKINKYIAMIMRTDRQKKIEAIKLPEVDYGELTLRIKSKVDGMTYWPTDCIVEATTRLALEVLTIEIPDSKSAMAMDIRVACYQYLIDRGQSNAESILEGKLKHLHEKCFDNKYNYIGNSRRNR